MEKLIDGILTVVSVALIGLGGRYARLNPSSLHKAGDLTVYYRDVLAAPSAQKLLDQLKVGQHLLNKNVRFPISETKDLKSYPPCGEYDF